MGYILRLEYGFCPEETEMEERVAGRESKTRKSWNDFLKEQYNSGYGRSSEILFQKLTFIYIYIDIFIYFNSNCPTTVYDYMK